MTELEAVLWYQMTDTGLPVPLHEYEFAPPRKWRADFAFLDWKIIIECEGGTYVQGRHNRPEGFENDCEKYNEAQLQGWMVLRFTRKTIYDGTALNTIIEAVKIRKEQ